MSAPVSSVATGPTPRKRRWLALGVLAAYVIAVVAGGIFTDHRRPLPDPTKPVKGWQWWITPHEQNAFMRMPVITGALYGMDVSADGQVIVLVGDEDFLLTSVDSGQTWIRGTVSTGERPTTPEPSGAFNFSFGLTGTAYAEAPERPRPQQQQQQQQVPVPEATQPPAATPDKSASDSKRARATTKGRTPVAGSAKPPPDAPPPVTEPAKAPLVVIPLPEGKPKLLEVSIIDNNTFVAVGERGFILRSVDAGRTWSTGASATRNRIDALACTPKLCLAADSQGTLFRSLDAGASWHIAVLEASGLDLLALVELDDYRFLASDRDGRLQALDAAGQALGSKVVATLGYVGSELVNHRAAALAIDRDRKTGIAVTDFASIRLTRDGGETWRAIVSANGLSQNRRCDRIAFAASGSVVALTGSPAKILWSEDFGDHWSADNAPALTEGRSRARLASTEQGEVFVLGEDNALFKRSVDGRWAQLAFGSWGLRDLEMQRSRGLLVGSSGTVFSTEDGGDTWEPRDSGVDAVLNSVAFGDDERAIVVGEEGIAGGVVIHTSDAGQSWDRAPLSKLSALHSVRFSDPTHVFAQGVLQDLESTDAGSSWSRRASTFPWVTALGFADAQNGVRSGSGPLGSSLGPINDTQGTTDAGRTWQKLDDVQVLWVKRSGRTRYALFNADGAPVPFPGALALPANALKRLRDTREIAFNENGVGIAIPTSRAGLLRTTNNGQTWAIILNPMNAPLESVRFAGKDRVVALAQGRVAVSDDAGETFRPVTYRRYPSPWLWLSSLLLVVGVLVYARSSINAPAVDVGPPSIADAAASDRPIQWWDPDHAGLRDIALGLSRFLRNRKTDPPLTIAVTGEWGTGKSSLMNLLRHDLERFGYKPVWFNAWHHQSGENLLGSLLANIHAQGVPSFLSMAGLDFRVSLAAIRGRRLWLQASLILVVFAVVGFSYSVLKDKWFVFWSTLSGSGDADFSGLKAATGVFGFALAVLWQLAGVGRMVSAFGLQPGKLIAAVASTSEDESARNQAGARYRFAREFEDFTRALEPRPLVVFIDDLDRCRAPNVVETLEAVNFLVSSGRCIVVLGMARHWVETCVGLAFKELADAHVEATNIPATSGGSEQQLFARHYLEKLINIEIRVPQLSDAAASAILQGSEPSAPHHDLRYALGSFLLRVGRWSAVLLAVLAIGGLGRWIAQSFRGTTVTEVSAAEAAPHQVAVVEKPISAPNAPTAPVDKPPTPIEVARVEPSRQLTSTAWYWSGGALAALGMVALAALALFARRDARTDDSPAFREALRIWQPFILLGGSSPRSLKRFINQLRYLAMRSRLSPDTTTAYERITKSIRSFFGRNTPEIPSLLPPRHNQLLTEELLVALAALHRCSETWLHTLLIGGDYGELEEFLARELSARLSSADERDAVIARLVKSALEFNDVFPSSALFLNSELDEARAQAFFGLMAVDDVPSPSAKIGATPAPPQVTAAPAEQVF